MKKKKYMAIMMSMLLLSACSIKDTEDMVSGNDGNVSSTVTGNEAGTFDTTVVTGMDDKDGMEKGEVAPESPESDIALVAIDETNFPDPVFRQYVSSSFDHNQDGKLDSGERNGVKNIFCDRNNGEYGEEHIWNSEDALLYDEFFAEEDTPDWYVADEENYYELEEENEEENGEEKEEEIGIIKSLQGIEFFPKLSILSCRNHQLITLDVHKNTELTYLNFAGNQISELELGTNRKLNFLNCEGNQLVKIDVSAKSELNTLLCNDNALESIDISGDIRLMSLDISNNPISKLDVSVCPFLAETVHEGESYLLDKATTQMYRFDSNEVKADYEDTLFSGKLQDVDKEAWYADAVYFVNNKLYMNTFSEGIFEPDKAMNRAQFVTALYNIAGCPKVRYDESFQDVPRDVWYARPAVWAIQKKITSGISENLFGADQELTHEQLVSILYKYASKAGLYVMTYKGDALEVYSDKAQVDTWAKEAMQWAASSGIWIGKQGEAGEKLDPKGITTRAECAQILRNLFLNTLDSQKRWAMEDDLVERYRVCLAEPVIEPVVDKVALAEANLSQGAIVINKTNFPDPTFRQYVIDTFDENDDRILEREVLEGVDTVDISSLYDEDWNYDPVKTLQGIEYFPNLNYLNCGNGNLENLDLSKNTSLTNLDCWNNRLTELDLSKNVELVSVECGRNQLSNLNLNENTKLCAFYCGQNKLTELDISHNTELENLDCSGNLLESLNIDRNPNLQNIYCSNNKMTDLNVNNATGLRTLDCCGNPLKSLNVDKNIELRELRCDDAQLTELDLGNNQALLHLSCSNNQLKSLKISSESCLQAVIIGGNPIDRIDVSTADSIRKAVVEGTFRREETNKECGNYVTIYNSTYYINSDFDDLLITGAFKDVVSGASYEDAVYFVTNKHFLDGTSEGMFEPDKGMNRLQAVQTLYNIDGNPRVKDVVTCKDVSEEDAVPVTWALNRGIASVISEDSFGSDMEVTHEQFVTMLYKYASVIGYIPDQGKEGLLNAYSDKDQISDWAVEGMQWAVANGIVNGSVMGSDTTLDPKGITTRRECAQIIRKFFIKIEDNGNIYKMISKYFRQ